MNGATRSSSELDIVGLTRQRLTLLAPDIVEAILDGRQPEVLGLRALLEPFPIEWGQQRTNWFGAVEGSEKATGEEIAAAHSAPRTEYRRQRNRRSIRRTNVTKACNAAS